MHRGKVAICTLEKNTDDTYRVIAAKVADKLLTIKGVEASVVLVRIGDTVNISARSGGAVNVQLVLEKCGGGGHFDMAGAQLKNTSMREAVHTVKSAINAYLDNTDNA